ncbi:MAG: D-alanyl-D-alanine carboxypeptidase [Streptococcaceae bacterium]|nr:D-alanyl-D-alanine carboxypeptidase [Streptococcaceae bacterium]
MKKFGAMMIALVILLGLSLRVDVITAKADSFDVSAQAAIAIDSDTGKIFYTKDENTKRGISSITKILTAYMTYQAVAQKKLKWDDEVVISDYSYRLSQNMELSGVPFIAGKKYTVKELLNAALVASANSAAVSLAEKIAGSEPNFVDMAKAQLKKWGIDQPHLVNASGLNNEYLGEDIYPGSASDDENQLSAKDIAIIARHLINDYPEVLEITKQTTASWDDTTMQTWNWMLPDMAAYREGVDGLKTGTTELAGQCFVGTIKEGNVRLITVVLNAENTDTDAAARFTATNQLMDYVLDNWSRQIIVKKGVQVKGVKAMRVADGKRKKVSLVASTDFKGWLRNDWTLTDYQATFTPINSKQGLIAPITAEKTEAGSAVIKMKDDSLGYLDAKNTEVNQVIMVAKTDVAKENFIRVAINHFINWVNEKL